MFLYIKPKPSEYLNTFKLFKCPDFGWKNSEIKECIKKIEVKYNRYRTIFEVVLYNGIAYLSIKDWSKFYLNQNGDYL